ncbi:MAG TPA: hypothetical protein VNY75_00580 [Rhizomicrobium sp.]|nr:hypothetical protein [Rhizomicrobium sp.]
MKRAILVAFVLAAAGIGAASSADAAGWRAHHPRRAEVNMRLNNQNHRIAVERREGELTRAQAADLHVEDRGIRAQERFDASRNGGHITRAQQARLNHEENQVSRQIGR